MHAITCFPSQNQSNFNNFKFQILIFRSAGGATGSDDKGDDKDKDKKKKEEEDKDKK